MQPYALLAEDDGLPMRDAGPWAAEKLDYLRRYIDVFETSMRRKWTERNYVDLLAGPGKNRVRDTGKILLGSPLLALAVPYPFTGYYFVDCESSSTETLSKRLANIAQPEQVHIITGDCNVVVDGIVARLRRTEEHSLNLAFLDPEGLEVHWATVAKLATVRRMDLIINYPEGSLNRAMRKSSEQTGETAVDRFFGSRAWRSIHADWQSGQSRAKHRQLIDLYRRQLQDSGYGEVRESGELSSEPLVRNTQRNVPLYRLLFASKHPLGETFWRKVTGRDVHGKLRLCEAP